MRFLDKLTSNIKSFRTNIFSGKNNMIIHNVYVLYLVFIIALANLFYLTVESDIVSILIFVIIGYLTSFFSKNMIIILVVAVVFTNVLKKGTRITQEGATGSITHDEDADDKETSTDKKKDKKKSKSSSSSSSDSETVKEGVDDTIMANDDKHQKLANNIASVLKAFDNSK